MNRKASVLATEDYTNHEDRRTHRKEHQIGMKHSDLTNLEMAEVHGKDHHIQFTISPRAEAVGRQVAKLFKMSLNQYAKAVLYLNLGYIYEPTMKRR
jgi:hypothetical protein